MFQKECLQWPPHFISPGKSKEAEIKRINKELANIRSKFKGDKALDGYSKKKYVCKLLFIFLLGHDIDFGHMEAVNLLSSNKYTEKQIVSVLRLWMCHEQQVCFACVMEKHLCAKHNLHVCGLYQSSLSSLIVIICGSKLKQDQCVHLPSLLCLLLV